MSIRVGAKPSIAIATAFILVLPLILMAAASSDKPQYNMELKNRVNAHGDEFNAVKMSDDGKRLYIGTEKGEVLVWNIPENRIVQRLNQGSPVHALVLLAGDKALLTAGGDHFGNSRTAVIRKWNLENGSFEEWTGMGNDSVLFLRAGSRKSLIVGSSSRDRIVVWHANTGKPIIQWNMSGDMIAGLAMIGRTVFFAAINDRHPSNDQSNSILSLDIANPSQPPKQVIPRKSGRIWSSLSAAPDGELLAATLYNQSANKIGVVLIDPANGNIKRMIDNVTASVWFAPDSVALFDTNRPTKSIRLETGVEESWGKQGGFHGQGDPASMADFAVTKDSKIGYAVYQKGAALARFEKGPEAKGDILTMTPGFIYVMDILVKDDNSGIVLTGGDDGYVRAWKLSDFSLLREFHSEDGFPQGVAILDNGLKAVFSYSKPTGPTSIVAADLDSGKYRKILTVEKPYLQVMRAGDKFVYQNDNRIILTDQDGGSVSEFAMEDAVKVFAVSENGRWLASADQNNVLYLFDLALRKTVQKNKAGHSPTRCEVSNDGRYVYTTEFAGALRRWDVRKNDLKKIGDVWGQTASLQLSDDDQLLIVGGNHRDIGIYNAGTGKQLSELRSEAADFYITNVWLKNNRLIFTTDSGILLDGTLK